MFSRFLANFAKETPGFFEKIMAGESALDFLPAPLQKLVGDFFLILGREVLREIWWEFCGIFSDTQNKGWEISGKISEHFSWENSSLKNNLSCKLRSAELPP